MQLPDSINLKTGNAYWPMIIIFEKSDHSCNENSRHDGLTPKNMKRFLLLLLLLFCIKGIYAQDLIIKTNGDSIPCLIKEVGALYIEYLYNNSGQAEKINMALKDVLIYQFNVLPVDPVLSRKSTTGKKPRIFLAASLGLGYMTAEVPDDLQKVFRDYYNNLKTGFSYHLDGAFYFNQLIGIGLHYSHFRTSNSLDNVIFFRTRDTIIGTLSDDITVDYIAPTINFKFGSTQNKFSAVARAGVGYAGYLNLAQQGEPYKITGSTVGLHIAGNIEYNLTYELALFLKAGIYSIFYTGYNVENKKTGQRSNVNIEDEPDNNSRIDLHIGIRYALGKIN
jgi:hypothetical protein